MWKFFKSALRHLYLKDFEVFRTLICCIKQSLCCFLFVYKTSFEVWAYLIAKNKIFCSTLRLTWVKTCSTMSQRVSFHCRLLNCQVHQDSRMLLLNDAWRTELETHLWKWNLRQKPFGLIWLNGASSIFKINPRGRLHTVKFSVDLFSDLFVNLSNIHSIIEKNLFHAFEDRADLWKKWVWIYKLWASWRRSKHLKCEYNK